VNDLTKEKKQKHNDRMLIISIGIIVLLFAALLYWAATRDRTEAPTTIVYRGFVFEKAGNTWKTNFVIGNSAENWTKNYEMFFHYNPYEVETVESMTSGGNRAASRNLILPLRKIYITTDPDYPASVVLSGVEVAKVLGQIYGINTSSATIRPDNRSQSAIVTCANNTATTGIVYLKLGNSTRVYNEQNCVIVEGTDPVEMLKASEKLTYELLAII